MQITILGAGGFLGRRIARMLAAEGALGGEEITGLTLFDLEAPEAPNAAFPVRTIAGDVAELPDAAIPRGTRVVFHLAAVVSAAAEADFELGRRVNVGGTEAVIDACRRLVAAGDAPPRVVFTSSVASFSGGQLAVLPDDARQVPGNSYGMQKAVAELFLADATRRGFLDAVSIRPPTIIVRPGRPNKAASGFVSSIIREPLLGLPAELPVGDEFAVWVASPHRAIEWLLHAAVMDTHTMGLDRGINPPGISATVAHMLAALEEVKPGAGKLIRRVDDPATARIIGTWPAAFEAIRSRTLGFSPHERLVEVVQAFVEYDLEGTRKERGR